jgi:hypothetical protein
VPRSTNDEGSGVAVLTSVVEPDDEIVPDATYRFPPLADSASYDDPVSEAPFDNPLAKMRRSSSPAMVVSSWKKLGKKSTETLESAAVYTSPANNPVTDAVMSYDVMAVPLTVNDPVRVPSGAPPTPKVRSTFCRVYVMGLAWAAMEEVATIVIAAAESMRERSDIKLGPLVGVR